MPPLLLITTSPSTTTTPILPPQQNENSSHSGSGFRQNKNKMSRRSLAVKRTSSHRISPGRNPSASSLGSSSIMDVDDLNGNNHDKNNLPIAVDTESLLVPPQPPQPLEVVLASAETLQISIPWWKTILENPSLRMGRMITLGAAAIYGTNFATVKSLDDSMPLSISAALRFGLASAVVSAMVLGGEKDDVDAMEEKERNLAFWSGAEIGVWYSIGYLSQAEGLQTVAAGKSAFFNALAVIVVPILDALIKGKILQRKEIAAVGLACLGVGLLEVGPSGLMITPGDILAFMQTIFFGIGYWRLEAVSHTHPHQAARITVGQLGAVATGATIYALTEFGLGHLELSIDQFVQWMGDPFILGALMWTGLISTALALYLETVALKVVSATELTLLMTTTSLWGASFAYVTIGETLSPTGFMGGLMILGGCVLGNTAAPAPKEKMDKPMAAIDQHMEDRPLVS